jgi:glycosyltransferase involved in cell wall biosynthesis
MAHQMHGLFYSASTRGTTTVILAVLKPAKLTIGTHPAGNIGRLPVIPRPRDTRHRRYTTPMSVLVSVIVPTFNRAYCVGRAIDSALQQTHRDLEIIVIDDGSVDETRQLIETKYGKMASIIYIYQENQGVATARNTALRAAQGEFVAFLDSDFSPMVTGNLVHTSTAVLRRDRADRVGGFNEEFHLAGEDYDYHLRTCREGPVGFIDLATISYQTGMPDQLVRHSYWLARNFLKTVTTSLERDKDRISLPPRLVNEVLAQANSWLAETLIPMGEVRGARNHFRRSLRYKPWQPRAAAQLALCQLPLELAEGLRRVYRRLKGFAVPRRR